MKKRVLAGLLWFYATWYAWSMVAALAGLPELLGPVVGAAVAMLVAGDPFGRIWGAKPIGRPMLIVPAQQSEPA